MPKKDTAFLLNEYFKTKPETTVKKIRGQIDRAELYAYEKAIGKPLVDMNSQEIADMIKSFKNRSYSNKVYKVSYRTYDTILSFYRDFFNWYIDNCEVIKNPCNDRKIRGNNVIDILDDDNVKAFNKKDLEDVIDRIRNSDIEEYADYREAIMRLFYEGFPQSIDIVNLKESDIDHKKKTAMVKGREIQLSDRLYELLVKINKAEEFPAHRGKYLMLSYHGSYFKFPTRERFEKEFNDRDPEYWAMYISRLFNRDIKNRLNININARTLYLLGLYDFMVDSVGQEEADRLIMSVNNSDDTRKIMELAKEYNVIEKNVTTLKRMLMPYVSSAKA